MKFSRYLLALPFILFATVVYAQSAVTIPGPTTVVAVPVGDWITQIAPVIQDALLAIVTALVAWALRSLPAAIRTYVTAGITAQVEQICDHAIDWAIAAVAGASKDKVWTVPVGNAVVAQAVQYIIAHGPAWLVQWMGGKDLIAQKIIGRVQALLPDNAQVVGANVIVAAPSVPSNAGAAAPLGLVTVVDSPLITASPFAPIP
jgi:hypothetical protein